MVGRKQQLYKYKVEEEDTWQLQKGFWERTSGFCDSELTLN